MKSVKQFNNSNATQDKVFVKKKKMGNKVRRITVLVPHEKLEMGTHLDCLH